MVPILILIVLHLLLESFFIHPFVCSNSYFCLSCDTSSNVFLKSNSIQTTQQSCSCSISILKIWYARLALPDCNCLLDIMLCFSSTWTYWFLIVFPSILHITVVSDSGLNSGGFAYLFKSMIIILYYDTWYYVLISWFLVVFFYFFISNNDSCSMHSLFWTVINYRVLNI